MLNRPADNYAYKGFETSTTRVMMRVKMYGYIGLSIITLQIVIVMIYSIVRDAETYQEIWRYISGAIPGAYIPSIDALWKAVKWLASRAKLAAVLSFGLWFFLPVLVRYFSAHGERQEAEQYIRGARLTSPATGKKDDIHIGNVAISRETETQHFFLLGRPGTGKTVAMRQVLDGILPRQGKSIIYDYKGDYLCKYYRPDKDIIYNPLDARMPGWNIRNEIETKMDVDSIAVSLIPPSISNTDPFWQDAARDVLIGLMRYLHSNSKLNNATLWEMVSAPAKEIEQVLASTPGGERGHRYVEDASGKQALSVLATLMQYAKAFEYLSGADGDFSLRRWIREPGDSVLYITSYSTIEATLRPILSLAVDLLSQTLLSMPDDRSRRVYMLLDEFGTLQRLSSIQRMLTLSRSKGGSVFLGIQDVGQIDKLYGREGRQTIVNACGSGVVLGVSDPETAEYASKWIGETEVIETREGVTMGIEDNRDGLSLSRQSKVKRLVMSAELQTLPPLKGYVRSGDVITQTQLSPRDYRDVAQSLILRDGLSL